LARPKHSKKSGFLVVDGAPCRAGGAPSPCKTSKSPGGFVDAGVDRVVWEYGDTRSIHFLFDHRHQSSPAFLPRPTPLRHTPSRRPHGSMNFRSFEPVNAPRPPGSVLIWKRQCRRDIIAFGGKRSRSQDHSFWVPAWGLSFTS
jgi:hypothetical protein